MAIELLFHSSTPYRRRGNELIYKECPLCGNNKWNIQINLAKGFFHCWACDRGGRLRGLSVLASEFGIVSEPEFSPDTQVILLPETAKPIWLIPEGSKYLEIREVTEAEARRLNILYDNGNLYVPYFEDKELVAFNVRTKEGKWMFNGTVRETVHYLIRGKSDSVILAEGLFDGIKLARTGHNVFVLFGRILYDNQIDRLLGIFEKFILALDRDRPGIMATIRIAKQLDTRNADMQIVKPPSDRKDFGECSDKEIEKAFSEIKKLGIAEVLKLRMLSK